MANQGQNFANHTRTVAPFHYVALPILLANFLWRVWSLFDGITIDASLNLLLAVALIIVALVARTFALGAQDRVIRLEMRLRMRELLPELLEILDDVLDELDVREEVEYVHRILEEGTSADRQLRVFEETGDLGAVIDYVVRDSREGLGEE